MNADFWAALSLRALIILKAPRWSFDQWGISVKRTELRSLAYPKSPTAPVCSCFGVNEEEIREDAESGRKDRVRELIARAETSAARCETESPSGASCVVEVRKIFLKYFSPSAY